MNHHTHTENAGNALLTCARVVVIAGTCAPLWAQVVEPVPKSVSPLPEARFFDTRPIVGAPLAPQYRNRQPAEADATQPERQPSSAKGEPSQAGPVTKAPVEKPMPADGKSERSKDCEKVSTESGTKCVELIAK